MSSTEVIYKKYYSDDGKLIKEGRLLNWNPIGIWKFYYYYKSGSLKKKTEYLNKVRHGICKKFYPNYRLQEELIYVNGKRHGYCTRYHDNLLHTIHAKGNYVNDNNDGIWIGYNESGIKHGEAIYNNGKLLKETSYYDSGSLAFEYIYENGIDPNHRNYYSEVTHFKRYFESGALEEEYNHNGLCKYYKVSEPFYPFRRKYHLSLEGLCINGKRNGLWKAYLYDGSISEEYEYNNNEFNYYKKYYNTRDNKTILTKEVYNNYEEHKIIEKEYYCDGIIKKECEYLNGSINYEDIINGKLHGVLKKYYEDGSIKKEIEYDHGIPIGIHKEYYQDGSLRKIGRYENGKEKGEWITYYK